MQRWALAVIGQGKDEAEGARRVGGFFAPESDRFQISGNSVTLWLRAKYSSHFPRA